MTTDEFKKSLIESGECSKFLLDYIDERINEIMGNRLCEGFGDVEEKLMEEMKSGFVRKER